MEDIYETSDLGVAAYLVTKGYTLNGTAMQGEKRLRFQFVDTPQICEAVTAYLGNGAQAPARTLFETYKSLKALAVEKSGNPRRR